MITMTWLWWMITPKTSAKQFIIQEKLTHRLAASSVWILSWSSLPISKVRDSNIEIRLDHKQPRLRSVRSLRRRKVKFRLPKRKMDQRWKTKSLKRRGKAILRSTPELIRLKGHLLQPVWTKNLLDLNLPTLSLVKLTLLSCKAINSRDSNSWSRMSEKNQRSKANWKKNLVN